MNSLEQFAQPIERTIAELTATLANEIKSIGRDDDGDAMLDADGLTRLQQMADNLLAKLQA